MLYIISLLRFHHHHQRNGSPAHFSLRSITQHLLVSTAVTDRTFKVNWTELHQTLKHPTILRTFSLHYRRIQPHLCFTYNSQKIISLDMKGGRVLTVWQKNSCYAGSLPGRLRWCQPPIQRFAKYRAIFVSIQMFTKYRGTIFGRFWFWIFTLPSALLILGTDFEVFVALLPSVMPQTNSITVLSNWWSDFSPSFQNCPKIQFKYRVSLKKGTFLVFA